MAAHTTGFDTAEPKTRLIALFGVATMVLLAVILLVLEGYVDRVKQHEIFIKVEQPVSADLQALRAREDADLNAYRYIDRAKGTVRLPVARAMELLLEEHR